MWTKKRVFMCGLSLYFCLSWAFAGICSANRVYEISETELTQLQNHLDALEQNNKILQMLLSESDEQSTIALNKLMESQKELATLKMQLKQAQIDKESATKSLETANLELQKAAQSFKESEKEHAKIEGRLRTKCTVLEVLLGIATGFAIAR